jgi:hypothetical protein
VLIASWAAAVIVAIAPWTPLRAAAGLLLVLVLPGTLATYAALPPSSGIDGRLRAVLIVALSVAIALVLGLGLALASDEISHVAAAVGLGLIATVSALIAFVREPGQAVISLPQPTRVAPAVALVSGALLVAFVALVVAALNVDSLPGRFTALALTREGNGVRLLVENREAGPVRYRYVLRSGDGVRLYSGAIRVDAGEVSALVLPVASETHLVDATLYRGGGRPYRSVDLRF